MTPKTRLMKKALRLWYLKYLKDCCEVCGGNYHLVGHHYYFRSSYGHLKYSKDNHITLCRQCHFLLHHQDPKKIELKIIEVKGGKWYKRLQEKAINRPQGTYQTINYYKEIIKQLELSKL